VYDGEGDIIDYTYTVTNTGNVTVTDPVSITDDRIAAVSCPALPTGGLAPGDNVVCSASYTVTQADVDVGSVTNLATANAGGLASPEVSETATANQSSSIETVKTAVSINFENPGDLVEYEYVVTNTGNVTVTSPVTVTDNLIPVIDCPALPAGGLLPAASLTCEGTYIVTQDDLDRERVTNVAFASDGTTQSPPDSATIPANAIPSLIITKEAIEADFDAAGDVLTYQYTVRNNGNITLTGVTNIEDDQIGTIACFTGNITPGVIVTCQAQYTVTQADVDSGFVTNVAFGQNGNLVSGVVDVTVDAVQTPGLSVEKTALTTSFAAPGDTLDYEYLVTNTGNTTIVAPIEITDSRIARVNCPALPTGGLLPNGTLLCVATDTVSQADIDTGWVTNTATASDGTITSDEVSETVNGEQNRELSLAKTALDTDFAAPGDVLNYEYVLTNTGNTTLLGALSVADDRINNISCPPLPAGGLTPNAQITCTGEEIVTQALLDAGTVTQTVGAAQAPELTLIKTADISGLSDPVKSGDNVVYTLLAENTGNVSLTGVTVFDALLGGDVTASCTFPGNSGALAVGDAAVCTVDYTITQDDVDAGGVMNTASVSGTDPAGGSVTDTSDAGDQSVETPGLGGGTDGDPTNDHCNFVRPCA